MAMGPLPGGVLGNPWCWAIQTHLLGDTASPSRAGFSLTNTKQKVPDVKKKKISLVLVEFNFHQIYDILRGRSKQREVFVGPQTPNPNDSSGDGNTVPATATPRGAFQKEIGD